MVCYHRVVLPSLHEQLTTRTSGFHAAGNSCKWSPSRSTIPERKETLLMTDKRDKTELLTPTPTVTAPQGGRLVDPCPDIHQGGIRKYCDVVRLASRARVLNRTNTT